MPRRCPTHAHRSTHAGMLTAARWLLDELRLPLLQLDAAGYRLLLTGHSLGAGVATLLTALVRQIIPTARCFGYATPPVVSGAALLAHIEDYCISVVHRNDVIPRTTIRTCTQVPSRTSHRRTTLLTPLSFRSHFALRSSTAYTRVLPPHPSAPPPHPWPSCA